MRRAKALSRLAHAKGQYESTQAHTMRRLHTRIL